MAVAPNKKPAPKGKPPAKKAGAKPNPFAKGGDRPGSPTGKKDEESPAKGKAPMKGKKPPPKKK